MIREIHSGDSLTSNRETPISDTSSNSTLHHVEPTVLGRLLGSGAITEKEETAYQKTFSPALKQALEDVCKVKSLNDRKRLFSKIKTELNIAAAQDNKAKTAQAHILPVLEDRLLDGNRDQHYHASSTLLNPEFEYPERLEEEHPFGYQGELDNIAYLTDGDNPLNPQLANANKFLKETYPELPEKTHWDMKPAGQITRHSGWIQKQENPLIAIRTFGMTDGDRSRVGSVTLDLSSLRAIDREKQLVCLQYLENPDPKALPPGSQALLDKFEKECDQKLQKMHEELMQFDESPDSEKTQRCVDE